MLSFPDPAGRGGGGGKECVSPAFPQLGKSPKRGSPLLAGSVFHSSSALVSLNSPFYSNVVLFYRNPITLWQMKIYHQQEFLIGEAILMNNLPSLESRPALSTLSTSPPLPVPRPAPPPPTSTFGPAYAKKVAASAPCPPRCCLPGRCHECRSAAVRARGCK